MRAMTDSFLSHDTFICDLDIPQAQYASHLCVCVCVCACVDVEVCFVRVYVRHDSFICVTRRIHMCDMTHSYVRCDSFTCVT